MLTATKHRSSLDLIGVTFIILELCPFIMLYASWRIHHLCSVYTFSIYFFYFQTKLSKLLTIKKQWIQELKGMNTQAEKTVSILYVYKEKIFGFLISFA